MLKHFFSFLAGVGMLGDTVLPLLARDHIAWLRWRIPIIVCAFIALVGLGIQLYLQYQEDQTHRKEDKKFQETITNAVEDLLEKKNISPEAVATPISVQMETEDQTLLEDVKPEGVDGEVFRAVISPRTAAWPIVRDIYRLQGRPQEAKVDCDLLLDMYLVNKSKSDTKYVRDFFVSIEVDGHKIFLQRQDDLHAFDFNNRRYDYGVKKQRFADAEPIKQLFQGMPIALGPEQPIEGWVRFLAKDINPDSLDIKTLKISILDSVGNEYPITKSSKKSDVGEIGIRRTHG